VTFSCCSKAYWDSCIVCFHAVLDWHTPPPFLLSYPRTAFSPFANFGQPARIDDVILLDLCAGVSFHGRLLGIVSKKLLQGLRQSAAGFRCVGELTCRLFSIQGLESSIGPSLDTLLSVLACRVGISVLSLIPFRFISCLIKHSARDHHRTQLVGINTPRKMYDVNHDSYSPRTLYMSPS
jgi:hypothetical protein